jgi:hypothetical protein
MRTLRSILRLTLAFEAAGFLSLVFIFATRRSKLLAAASSHHLAGMVLAETLVFILLLACSAAVAAWRIKKRDRLGRWSLLAASIFNLVLFPFGTILAASGIFYFARNPAPDPVLDRPHKPVAGDGTSKWSGAFFIAAQLAWGIFVLSSITGFAAREGMRPIQGELSFWIILFCAEYGSILAHELGHLVAGDIVRFRLIGFRVGPFDLMQAHGRWRLRMTSSKMFGGHTAMVPKTPRNIRERAMILTFGGPLASALLGAVGAVSLMLIPGPAWPAALGRIVALATGFALGDFLLNLIPFVSEAQYSDGARLWQMYRRGPWCDYLCAHHYMGLSRSSPLRPRDWPTALVERAAEFARQLPEPAASYTKAYVHFLDRGECERAIAWLDKALQAARPGSKIAHSLTIDRAFLDVFYRQDPEAAARRLEQVPVNKDSSYYWCSLAAILAAQNDLAGSAGAWNKASDIAAAYPAAGIYDMIREQLQTVHARLAQLPAQPVSAQTA